MHEQKHHHHQPSDSQPSLNSLAFRATVHCLTGCSIGEILGMVVGTGLGWSNLATTALAIVLAFLSGYALTLVPLLKQMKLRSALSVAFATDTLSIGVMEVVDNGLMFLIPGAMDAHLDSALFWLSLAASLVLAGVVAFPVNRWLVSKGVRHSH